MPFVEGFLIGIGMILFIGPVFFYLFKTSLINGRIGGLFVALGVIVGDGVYVLICNFGFATIILTYLGETYLALCGAVILLALGIRYVLKKDEQLDELILKNESSNVWFFMKGFLINFINPFVFLVWIGLTTYSNTKFTSQTDIYIFLFSILLGIFVTDLTKVMLANRLKYFLDPKKIRRIYKILGVVLIGFGLRLTYRFFVLSF